MLPETRDPALETAVLGALHWTADKTPGQQHTLDDFLRWHRISRKDDDQYQQIVDTLDIMVRLAIQNHETVGSYELTDNQYQAHRFTANGDNELGLPYMYGEFDIISAYGQRFSRSGSLLLPRPRYDSQSEYAKMLRRLGDEDVRLLDLAHFLGGSFSGDLKAKKRYGRNTEWCVRQSSLARWIPERLYDDAVLYEMEPSGIYLQAIQDDLTPYGDAIISPKEDWRQVEALDLYTVTLIEKYKKCRAAGMSHALTMHMYLAADIDRIIALATDLGEEYTFATIPQRLTYDAYH